MKLDRSHPKARYARVLVDGIDVTRQCEAADDVEGWADVFLLAPTPQPRIKVLLDREGPNPGAVRKRLTGHVQIALPDEMPKGFEIDIDTSNVERLAQEFRAAKEAPECRTTSARSDAS